MTSMANQIDKCSNDRRALIRLAFDVKMTAEGANSEKFTFCLQNLKTQHKLNYRLF